MKNDTFKLLDLISQTIYDKKGMNILVLDVRGISSMTDFFLIAEGTVDRHVRALSLSIEDRLEDFKLRPIRVEGQQEGDWIVMDYGDVVIHLFTPEMRDKYAFEQLWREGKIVDVKIITGVAR